MRPNRRLLYWGVFFLAAGAVMLAAQGATVTGETVAEALRLWPLAIIALGVGLLLRRTRFATAGGVMAAAMPGLLLGGLVVAAPQMSPDCGNLGPTTLATREGTFDGAASVELRLACGELKVSTAPGAGWTLQTANGAGPAPTVESSADRLSVASATGRRAFGLGWGGDDWRLSLPTATLLDLAVEVDAGRGQLDLAGAQLGDVRLAANAADLRVDLARAAVTHLSMVVNAASASVRLPETQDLQADLSVNAGALRICAASNVGVRIHHDGVLGATNYAGLVRNGDTWESPNAATAIHHADVTVTANVGSVDVNPLGGCQ
jgi:hypothetical protein